MENLKELILMDGNGLFVWFCLIFFLLVLTLNIIFSYRRKLKIVKSIKNKICTVFPRPPHLWGGHWFSESSPPPYFRVGGGAPPPFWRKYGGGELFWRCVHAGLGAIFGVFFPSNLQKSSKFSSLAPSALASHFYTSSAEGAHRNNAFVSTFVWRDVLLDLPQLF